MRAMSRIFFAVLTMLGLTSACNQELPESATEPTAERTAGPLTPSAPPSQETALQEDNIRKNAVSGSNFELVALPAESYTVKKEAAFTISLKPRGAYHINQKFPTSVTTQAPKSIALEKPQLVKSDAKLFSEQQVKFEVAFSASEAGEHELKALVNFAVCTEKTCIPLRKNLPVSLKVN